MVAHASGAAVHDLSIRFHVSHETVNQIVRGIPLRPRGLSPDAMLLRRSVTMRESHGRRR